MSELDEVKLLLSRNAEALARELVPTGYRTGHYWIGACPWRNDARPGSFWVNLPGAGVKLPGSFRDAATGEKGSAFDLVMKAHNLDFRGALAWSRAWLGLSDMAREDRAAKLREAAAANAADAAEETGKLDKARKWAFAKYVEARKRPFVGSVADVYLRSRGIDVSALPRLPGVLGWLPEQDHFESKSQWPVMLAGMQDADGKTVAIHRTFLRPDGSGKAPVEPARKIWPSFAGCMIRLWRGEGGLSIDEACKAGVCERWHVCEGIEDGLSLVLADPGPRTVCAGSLGNLANLEFPPCCDELVVCADNDWGKPQAKKQFDKAIDVLARKVPKVLVARSAIGKDANDALRGGDPWA
jgi:hypothetical protein